jgi:tetratricopeptide (TPR) repeat protein
MLWPQRFHPHAVLVVAWIILGGTVCLAVEPAETTAKKPDWAGLESLLRAGDYARAATAADEIATALKPKRREPDFVAQSIGFFRALMRRGFAEFRLGRLDAAAATFEQARRIPRDSDFRRLLAAEARSGNSKVASMLVPLEVDLVELLVLRMLVILERLRLENLKAATAAARSPEEDEALRKQVADWLDDLDTLAKADGEARKSLEDRLDKASSDVLASPRNRALVGRFPLSLVAGIRSLELSRLPWGDPRPAANTTEEAAPGPAASERLADSRRQLADAASALDEAIAQVAPGGVATLKRDQNIEVMLLRSELSIREGEALLAAGDPSGSRERFVRAAEDVEQVATLRKLPQPKSHPDLFWPLVLCADAMLAEARRHVEKGDLAQGRQTIVEASAMLTRAEELPVPQDHPLRPRLLSLQALVAEDLAQAGAKNLGAEAADAADAAARRMRRTLDGAAVSSDIVAP